MMAAPAPRPASMARRGVRRLDRMRFLRRVPWRQSVLLYAGVGCTFGIIGFVSDLVALPAVRSFALVLASVFMCGLISCAYLAAAIHARRWFPFLVALQIGLTLGIDRLLPAARHAAAPLAVVSARATLDGMGALVLAAAGYALFITFIARQGVQQVRLETEMALAQEIHHDLVPPIERRVGALEVVGRSSPSTEVGGDLVDVIEDGEGLLAVVADVSGHGVPAGTLMAMVRSAIRVRVAAQGSLEAIVSDLDRLLLDLARPDKFVTLACLRFDGHGAVEALLAGHPPVLVVRASGAIERIENQRPPIGLPIPSPVVRLGYGAGDLFALVTDGLPETADGAGRHLELEPIERELVDRSGAPLPEIADAVFERARRHGVADDDQTLLLVRAARS